MAEGVLAPRESTNAVYNRMLDTGDQRFGVEPIGIVLLYPDKAFLKAIWTKEAPDRADTMDALIAAALDEGSKA